MNEITTKKDVNEILADSKSLTQYLEDVYEVEKNLYSVYQAKQRMEVIINQSGQERVMERKCPSFLHIGNIYDENDLMTIQNYRLKEVQ